MDELFGDELDAVVSWKSGSDISQLAGKPVRFHFALRDADVFALQTKKEPSGVRLRTPDR